ncbi:beta strand repeat-containing protein [Candidatus Spyradosoma sp. SGI.093]|uniref:beta strand repeat-containing protein n=1 Tax=Candidatus Spyradosoma sp. SGI.093 TaxID=3420583 RepID=UPI003D03DB46
MKPSKLFITSLLAAAAMSAVPAYATSLTDATLFIDSFDTETINSITDLGWSLSGISGSDTGIYTSTGTQATISAGTSGASLTTNMPSGNTNRYTYSAIFTVDASVFSSSNSDAVLLAGTNTGTTGAALKSGGLAGAWENEVWDNDTSNTPIAIDSDWAVNGLITIGISFDNGGTNLYVYGKDGVKTYSGLKGSGNITSIGLAKRLAGVQYSNLYWFNSKLEPSDMTSAMSIVATGTDTSSTSYFWAGTGSNNAWNTTDTNTNWTLSGNASAFVNDGNVYFGSDDALAKTVAIDSDVRAGTISVADNYTFAVGTDGSLAATSIAVAMGKTATVNLAAAKTLATNITSGVVKKTGASALTYSGTISSGATLEIAEGGTISVGASGAGTLTGANVFSGTLNNGGTLNISGGVTNVTGVEKLNGNVVIASGATLYSATTDAVTWHNSAASQILNVLGTLHLDARWSMGSGKKIVLSGGTITGTGGQNNNQTVSLDYFGSGTIATEVGATRSQISANIRIKDTLTFDVAADLAVSGDIVKTNNTNAKIVKQGAGTLTLSGRNTYRSLEISAGKLVAASAGALGSGAIANAGTLELAAATGTVSNVISGAGELTKTGLGTVTLAGTNMYTGQTTVSAGTLVAGNASALGRGNVVVADGATLARGLTSGSVAIGGTLTTNGAAILSTGALNAGTAAFAVTGAVTLDAGTIFNLSALETGMLISAGTVTFGDGSATPSLANFLLNGNVFGNRTNLTVSNTDGVLAIDSVTQNALALTWAGGDSGTWKANGSGWSVTTSGSAETFQVGDSVEFTSSNAGTVSVEGNVTVDTMKVSSGTYTFDAASGGGKIFSTGAVSVESGATMNLNGGVLGSLGGGFVVQNGGTLNVNAAVTTSSALSVDGTLTSSVAVSATQLSGSGRIDLGSTGTLSLSDSTKFNNWMGTVAFKDRTITHTAFFMANYGTTGSTIEFSGVDGVFAEFAETVNANLHLVNSTTNGKNYGYKVTNGTSTGAVTFAGKITGTGDIVMAWGTGTAFTFTGNVSEFEGKFSNTGKTSGANTNVVLTFSGTPQLSEGQSSVSGKGNIEWGNNCSVVYNYGAADVQADNKIVSAILKKQGTGSLKLTQANTYTGGTTVEAGTLIAANTSALGTGPVTVNSDAKLQVKAGMNVTVSTANSTTVTIAEGAKLVIDFAGVDLPAGAEERTFAIMTAAVFSIYGTTLSGDDVTTRMADAWELLNGDEAWLNSAKWTLDGNTLQLTLTIPEPSVFGLLAGLGALALAGTRRRRKKA